jgi:elongator complex protein 5
LAERREGVLVGLGGKGKEEERGVVVKMELRRKSGRGIVENFVLSPPQAQINTNTSTPKLPQVGEFILLDDHPLYASTPSGMGSEGGEAEDELESTFNLGLTEKQKRDREGVVLPYFDAQNESGVGEGGRILYEMGVEDREDFDDEEDEI